MIDVVTSLVLIEIRVQSIFNGFFFNLVLKSTGNFFLLSHTETELRGQSKQRTSLRKVTVRRYFVRSISGEAIPAKDRTLMNLSHASKISKIVFIKSHAFSRQ